MNNRFIHLIHIPFVGVGIRPFRGDDWFRYRVDIFKKYTLASLLNQTNRKFVLWLSFTPEVRDNPITLELEQYLKDKGILTFMTFSGLMYHDDKFTKSLKERIMNLARIVRMAWREGKLLNFGWRKVLREFLEDKNDTLKDRLTVALGHLKSNLDNDNLDWVYVTRIDSDDMFHREAVADIQTFQPFPGALTMRNGYVYNSLTGQMAEWRPKANPPFHTIIFPKASFFEPARYLQYFRGFKSHEDIPTVFNSQNLKDGRYCVVIHEKHISTIWDHPWKGKDVDPELLKEFNEKREFLVMDDHKFALPVENETNLAIQEIIKDYEAYKDRLWEPETTKLVKELVKPGDVCVDVGASIGYFTLLFARQVGEQGKVYTFEPTNNQFEYLKRNIELNGYKDRVEAHNLAAWDKEENDFGRRDDTIKTNAKIQVNAGFNNKIKGIVLDEVLPEKVDFMKIDVDGSEPRALKGLIKTFERNPQLKMVIEFYPECQEKLGNNPKDMMDILDKYFTYEKIEGDYGEAYWNYICTRK